MRRSLPRLALALLTLAAACGEGDVSAPATNSTDAPSLSHSSSTGGIVDTRLGVTMDPDQVEYNYAKNSHVRHARFTAYVRNFADTRYFDRNWNIVNPQTCGCEARTVKGWFYRDVNEYRLNGFKLVVTFHTMPDSALGDPTSDPYGDNLPQFIANTVRPAPDPNDPNVRALDDVLVAVQPGNENNTQQTKWTPMLRGTTAYDRGVSAGVMIKATRNALNAVGATGVSVWTAGMVLQDSAQNVDFLRGLLADAGAKAALGGISGHAYGWPPVHQLGAWEKAVRVVDPLKQIPLYSTETGSESLWAGNEQDGSAQVDQVLWWLTNDTYGKRYARVYWYAVQRQERGGDFGLIRPDGTERLAGYTFRTWPRIITTDPVAGMTAAIGGNNVIGRYYGCDWFASIRGGTAPYEYTWTVNGKPQLSDSDVLSYSNTGTSFKIGLSVMDQFGAQTYTEKSVVVDSGTPCM